MVLVDEGKVPLKSVRSIAQQSLRRRALRSLEILSSLYRQIGRDLAFATYWEKLATVEEWQHDAEKH